MNKKSFLAVFVGVVFIVVVTTIVDVVLHAVHVFQPMDQPLTDSLAALATAYRVVISIAGAWITARLAPHSPMKHAIILGVTGTILGLIGLFATWNLGLGPKWYPIALVVLAIPQCWIGGKFFTMSRTNEQQTVTSTS